MQTPSPQNFTNLASADQFATVSYSYQEDYDQPLFCVRCNSLDSVQTRTFSYSHIPLYAYLVCILNLFLGLIVIALSAGQHRIDLPCCKVCWRRYRLTAILAGMSLLLFVASMIGGVAMMLQLDSGYWFFPLPLMAVGVMIGLGIAKRRAGPRIERSSRDEVVVDAGHYGLVTFTKTTVARLSPSA